MQALPDEYNDNLTLCVKTIKDGSKDMKLRELVASNFHNALLQIKPNPKEKSDIADSLLSDLTWFTKDNLTPDNFALSFSYLIDDPTPIRHFSRVMNDFYSNDKSEAFRFYLWLSSVGNLMVSDVNELFLNDLFDVASTGKGWNTVTPLDILRFFSLILPQISFKFFKRYVLAICALMKVSTCTSEGLDLLPKVFKRFVLLEIQHKAVMESVINAYIAEMSQISDNFDNELVSNSRLFRAMESLSNVVTYVKSETFSEILYKNVVSKLDKNPYWKLRVAISFLISVNGKHDSFHTNLDTEISPRLIQLLKDEDNRVRKMALSSSVYVGCLDKASENNQRDIISAIVDNLKVPECKLTAIQTLARMTPFKFVSSFKLLDDSSIELFIKESLQAEESIFLIGYIADIIGDKFNPYYESTMKSCLEKLKSFEKESAIGNVLEAISGMGKNAGTELFAPYASEVIEKLLSLEEPIKQETAIIRLTYCTGNDFFEQLRPHLKESFNQETWFLHTSQIFKGKQLELLNRLLNCYTDEFDEFYFDATNLISRYHIPVLCEESFILLFSILIKLKEKIGDKHPELGNVLRACYPSLLGSLDLTHSGIFTDFEKYENSLVLLTKAIDMIDNKCIANQLNSTISSIQNMLMMKAKIDLLVPNGFKNIEEIISNLLCTLLRTHGEAVFPSFYPLWWYYEKFLVMENESSVKYPLNILIHFINYGGHSGILYKIWIDRVLELIEIQQSADSPNNELIELCLSFLDALIEKGSPESVLEPAETIFESLFGVVQNQENYQERIFAIFFAAVNRFPEITPLLIGLSQNLEVEEGSKLSERMAELFAILQDKLENIDFEEMGEGEEFGEEFGDEEDEESEMEFE